jgi:hypothetical protein
MIALCAGTIGLVAYFRLRSLSTPAGLLKRLPSDNAVVLYVDFEALRRNGILDFLSSPKVDEEAEYKTFIAKTGFDYRQDLDAAMVSFHANGNFFLLRGRFDWKNLTSYVREQGGTCYNTLCRMDGSTPERRISFFPLQTNLMAMAASPDGWAANWMNEPARNARQLQIPIRPVWLSIPSATLKKSGQLPEGTRLFAKAMEDAENVILALGPQGQSFEANLEVTCRSSRDHCQRKADAQSE